MGGFFGVFSDSNCINDLFFGTDYHSHLGTKRGGLAVWQNGKILRFIHDITNSQFRSKFEDDIIKMDGSMGIGVISDYEDQPLIIASHLGVYAIVTVGVINNINELANKAYKKRTTHFSEMGIGEINPTELVATLINQGDSFIKGIEIAQNSIQGSCSILLLTEQGIYAARDKLGRTPVIIGKKGNDYSVTMETSAFPNINYSILKYLGPQEVVLISDNGCEVKRAPGNEMHICAFLWVYYGYPSSNYEGINVEVVRNRCGVALAKKETNKIDLVAGIPDSGTGHAIGFANESAIPYSRPFVKYTPTWPRSFMPQDQSLRDLVAKMKLLPIKELIKGKKLLFCEDSIVRGTQLRDTIKRLFHLGAREVHMRPSCPPLVFGCKFLNFSRSRSVLDLAARQAIKAIEGSADIKLKKYSNPDTKEYSRMVEWVKKKLGLTSLRYQRLEDLVEAVGINKQKLCTYCWDGQS